MSARFSSATVADRFPVIAANGDVDILLLQAEDGRLQGVHVADAALFPNGTMLDVQGEINPTTGAIEADDIEIDDPNNPIGADDFDDDDFEDGDVDTDDDSDEGDEDEGEGDEGEED